MYFVISKEKAKEKGTQKRNNNNSNIKFLLLRGIMKNIMEVRKNYSTSENRLIIFEITLL